MVLPFLASILLLMPASQPPATIERAIEKLERGGLAVVAGEELCEGRLLAQFYRGRELEPAWDGFRARQMIAAIRAAETDGLDPADYHLASITALATERHRAQELDLLLTDSFLLLGSHLLTGKVDPKSLTRTWCLQPRAGDVAAALEHALETGDIAEGLEALRPAQRGYQELRQSLAAYRAIASAGGWSPVGAGPTLRHGDREERVDRLAARLRFSGDLKSLQMLPASFDIELEDAVRRFQERHGLDVDGIVGPATTRALDFPVDERIVEIELNLERLRWLPDPGSRFAVVNIAAFELMVIDDGQAVLRMGVVVGKPYQSTPVFSSRITEVIFSPYWNIPASIAQKEIWPEARRDPGYLEREHIEIASGGRLRQLPGTWNALGGVKFVAPNDYDVFLHDTPARTLFSRSSRAFSHGCMRLEKPYELAAWLLRNDPAWTSETIEAAAWSGKERSIRLREPLPLHVLYWTTWVDERGTLHFREDVYARNAPLLAALNSAVRHTRP